MATMEFVDFVKNRQDKMALSETSGLMVACRYAASGKPGMGQVDGVGRGPWNSRSPRAGCRKPMNSTQSTPSPDDVGPDGTRGTGLPLSAQLSHVFVSFTIECDNEFERQMPVRMTNHGSNDRAGSAPWHASMVMWTNFLRFIPDQGITVNGLLQQAWAAKTALAGMERWGYVTIGPDLADRWPRPPRADHVVHLTVAGSQAREVWGPLTGVIQERWRTRFGKDAMASLEDALCTVASGIEPDLPDCLPIIVYGLFNRIPGAQQRSANPQEAGPASRRSLPALVSRVLLSFALEHEYDSDLPLAIGANILRVLDENAIRVRDLPGLSGVSKEAIALALGVLGKKGAILIEPALAGSRTRVIRLTPAGRQAKEVYLQRLSLIESRWRERFGEAAIDALRRALERLVGEPDQQPSPLMECLIAYPGGWRASVPRPATLPHFPMVLHRGGYPDGS
jgi:DNA-binding MarR family transcriptional regulator